jgi:hypothetical protein
MAMGPNSVNQYSYEPGSSAISIGDTDNVTVYDMTATAGRRCWCAPRTESR